MVKKIQTVFERDWAGDRSRVLEKPAEGCEWVFAGEGVCTRKYDGTACLVEDGKLWKRREQRGGTKPPPAELHLVDHDLTTDKIIGWVPVGEGPDDKWYREALNIGGGIGAFKPGTYELVGPKVQGNPEHYSAHTLIAHEDTERFEVERTYEGLKKALEALDVEGFVFHHPDGRMAKIKGRDFGIKRGAAVE